MAKLDLNTKYIVSIIILFMIQYYISCHQTITIRSLAVEMKIILKLKQNTWIWNKTAKMWVYILPVDLTGPLISFPKPHGTKIPKQHDFC